MSGRKTKRTAGPASRPLDVLEKAGGGFPRRRVLQVLSALGVSSAVFGRALVALAQEKPKITEQMIQQAEWVSGLEFNDAKRKLMLEGVNDALAGYAKMRAVVIDNSVAPAVWFLPAPAAIEKGAESRGAFNWQPPAAKRPSADDDLAFAAAKNKAWSARGCTSKRTRRTSPSSPPSSSTIPAPAAC